MMQYRCNTISRLLACITGLLLWSGSHAQTVVTMDDCRPLVPATGNEKEPLVYSNALLWKITRGKNSPSYIFGTIHVADERITRLPGIVEKKLLDSAVYVMEALPDAGESVLLSQMMTFSDGLSLQDFIGEDVFTRTRNILADYNFQRDAVVRMKPWAAFLVMNYPAEEGIPLDLQLFRLAEQNNARLVGLETLSEQGEIFANMTMEKQVQLLLDTVCNYDTVSSDFDVMKSLYLQRDLDGLYQYSTHYSISSESLYIELLEKLLFRRNERMVERLLPLLREGDAFIAVGAMHLPGDEGILSRLADHGFSIKPIY